MLPITVRFASVTYLLLDESAILAVVVVSAFTTLDNPTSVFVTLCGFPLVSCEWSYAVLPLSHLYAVEEVSQRAREAEISVYDDQFHL